MAALGIDLDPGGLFRALVMDVVMKDMKDLPVTLDPTTMLISHVLRLFLMITGGPKKLALGHKQLETRGFLHRVYFFIANLN